MKNAAKRILSCKNRCRITADTAENGRNFAEILPKIGNYPTDPLPEVDAAAAPLGGWAPESLQAPGAREL